MNRQDDAELDRALRALALEDRGCAVPERVRALTMAAWDARRARDVGRVAVSRRMRAGAVAAVLCVAAAISLRTGTSAPPPLTSPAQPAQSPAAVTTPPEAASTRQPADPAVTRPGAAVRTTSAARARRRAAAAQVEPRAVADSDARLSPSVAQLETGERTATSDTVLMTDDRPFVALEPAFGAQPLGWFQVARVHVSRRVLVAAGVLATEGGGFDVEQADVLFGEDGRARAIRLISTTGRAR